MKKVFYTLMFSPVLFGTYRLHAQAITTVAGNTTDSYSGDGGPATNAQISAPYGIAVNGGNVYFSDANNNLVRKINTSGNISQFAGNGIYDYTGDGGLATAAEIDYPADVAVDGSGNIYLADEGNNVIRKINTLGIISTIAGNGTGGYSGDGYAATAGELYYPTGIAVDASGNIYIADQGNNVIRKVNTSGVISTIAGNGTAGYTGDGHAATAGEIDAPYSVAVDGSGNVYIADYNNNVIRKINTSGIISTYAGNGTYGYTGDGSAATAAEINSPILMKTDGSGNLFIADNGNNAIREVNFTTKIISTVAGNGVAGYTGDGSAATSAELNAPYGMAIDGSGNLYIADAGNNRIRKVNSSGIISAYGGGLGTGSPATAVAFGPWGSAIDGSGNIYIADADNDRICKVNTSGITSPYAGNGTRGYTGDGSAATAGQLDFPSSIAIDGSGNMFIADEFNNVIRKVTASGVISTFAGNDTAGYDGDGGSATLAELNYPSGVAVDGSGNIYIADQYNNLVRKVNTSGVISTYAGSGGTGYSGDGSAATEAELNLPTGIAVDIAGNLYIADNGNNAIRKINKSGVISTIAGNGILGYTGDGTAATSAELSYPSGVVVDSSGNLFIADDGNNVIRKINALGVISTMAGTSIYGYTGDGGLATSAELANPVGIAIDSKGKAYIADYDNFAMRKVNSSSLPDITGTKIICATATTALTDGTTGGTWTSSTSAVATVGLSSGIVTGVSAGTATIIYAVSGNTVITTVTINPLPNAGAIKGPMSVCIGSGITLTDAASGGVWSSSNTSATVSGGVVTSVSVGRDTIKYTVTNSCGAASIAATVTINPLPAAGTITGVSSVVCAGSTITLTDATSGGIWSSGNTSATVSGGVVTGVSAGAGIISYVVSTTCGTATATKAVTVNPLPVAGSITGSSAVCMGSAITLTDAASGGVWSSSNTLATVSGGVVTSVATGVDTIKYTVTNSCGTAIATKSVTINPLPVAGTITGSSSVCVASMTTLNDVATGGVWSSSNTTANVLAGVVAGVSAGTATISYTVTNSCGTAATTKTMTINPLPNAGTISGASSVCAGSTTTLTDAASGGVWSSSNTNVSVSGGVVTGIAAGTSIIKYTVTMVCGTTSTAKTLTINPLPVVSAVTGASNVCVGATITLTDATSGGAWSSSNTSASVSGGVVTGLAAGSDTIHYAVTNGCGATTVIKPITIIPAVPSAGTITGGSIVCVGATITLTDATPGGAWSSSNTSATVSAGVVTGVSAGTNTISYVITATCGTAYATKTVTVNPLLSAGAITGASSVCAGSSITLSDPAGSGVWSSSNTTAGVSGGVVTGASAGTDTITYSVSSACGTATTTKTITINPLPETDMITGATEVCAGAAIALTDATSGGVWSSSNTSATVSGGIVTGVSGGTSIISYAVTITCGTATATSMVTIDPLPTAGSISGATSVCAGADITLSDAAGGGSGVWSSSNTTETVSGGVVTGISAGTGTITYAVTTTCGTATAKKTVTINPLPVSGTVTGALGVVCAGSHITLTDATSGGVWSSSNTSATVSAGIVTGMSAGMDTINYAVTNVCGTATSTKTITVNPLPVAGTITGASGVCAGSTITLTDATGGGAWSATNIKATVSGGVVTGISSGMDTIKYSVSNSCGTAKATFTVTINPLPSVISGTAYVCIGSATHLSDALTGGNWSSPGYTGIISVGSTSGTVTGISAGTATVTYTLSTGCNIENTVTVDPLPGEFTVKGGGSFCVGDTGVHIGLSGSDLGIKYQLYVGVLPIGIPLKGTGLGLDFGLVTTGGVYTVVGIDTLTGCTNNMTSSAHVTANPTPVTITGTKNVCAGSMITLNDGTTGGKWTSSDITLASVVSGTGVVTGIATGIPSIIYTLSTGCLTTASITVNPLPPVITGATSVCAGATTTLSDAGGGAWSSGSVGIATIASTGKLTAISAGKSVITYKYGTGCAVTMTFTVNPLPAAIDGMASVCVGVTTGLSDPTSGGTWGGGGSFATINPGTGIVTGVSAGLASITYTLPTGCEATSDVTVNPLPDAGIISGETSVCLDSAIVLTDTASGGTWTSKNGLVIVTATGVITGVFAGADTISYLVTNACGTSNAIWPLSVVDCKLSVPFVPYASAELKVYPNPNEGTFLVNLLSNYNEPVSITITNIVGEKVKEIVTTTNNAVSVKLNVAGGVYLLTGITAHGKYVAKVTVE